MDSKYMIIKLNVNIICIEIKYDNILIDRIIYKITKDYYSKKDIFLKPLKDFFYKYYPVNIILLNNKQNISFFIELIQGMDSVRGLIEKSDKIIKISPIEHDVTMLQDKYCYCQDIFFYFSEHLKHNELNLFYNKR